MSGTSADGVDVAVTRIVGRGLRMRASLVTLASARFPRRLRERILAIRSAGAASLRDLAQMGQDLTLAYAKAAKSAMRDAGVGPAEVTAIAAHGQTLFHAPPLTIQWFDPALLAAMTGCQVISDFRRADCAVGGQGAPLVPFADYLLFRSPKVNRVLLNVGGIANITYLPAGGELSQVIAFDTGPGNCLSDAIAQEHLERGYDAGGRMAGRGTPDESLVAAFLRNNYFRKPFPKSTDGPEMLGYWQRLPIGRLGVENALATACLCCARCVADAVRRLVPGACDEIIAAGGGMHNRTLLRMLQQETGLPIRTTADFGIPIEAREAMAFALLGAATLDGEPSNLTSVTGACRPAILGSITPAPPRS